jgi:hypothetical protein
MSSFEKRFKANLYDDDYDDNYDVDDDNYYDELF